jgi:hypothetical protein
VVVVGVRLDVDAAVLVDVALLGGAVRWIVQEHLFAFDVEE